MPIVRIEMLPGRSQESKQKIAEEITATLTRALGVATGHIYVMFDEVAGQNWAVAGQFLPSGPSAAQAHGIDISTGVSAGAGASASAGIRLCGSFANTNFLQCKTLLLTLQFSAMQDTSANNAILCNNTLLARL